MKTLDLILKHHWYDMIASGEKKEEYREIKPYWIKRLVSDYKMAADDFTAPVVCDSNAVKMTVNFEFQIFWSCTHVRFRRGYSSTTMTFEIEEIKVGVGNSQWGAPKEEVFIIKLGKRL